jgi:aminotransferase
MEQGHTTYTANAGILELRQMIAAMVQRRDGVAYDPATEVLVTVGVSEALDLALRTILEPGDEVILFEPCYVSYGPCVAIGGGVPVAVPTRAGADFAIEPREVEARLTARTKAVLICSPGNPTGAVQPRHAVEALVDLARRHDLYLLSDEIYSRLVYPSALTGSPCSLRHCCVAGISGARERTVLLNGLSKSHAMTGWRIGYACAPEPLCGAMLKIHQYTALCAPHVSQMAAMEAIAAGDRESDRMVREYDRRRTFLVHELNGMGLECPTPQGAFYAFPSIHSTGLTSEGFAEALLQEEKVAVVPGNVFGPSGEGHVRCSFAASYEALEQAVAGMRQFAERHRSARRHGGDE